MALLIHIMEWRRAVGLEAWGVFARLSMAVCHLVNEGQSVSFITWTLPSVTRYCSPTHAPFLLQILASLAGVRRCFPIVRAAHPQTK